ncbi:hypothetical protein GF362_06630 [Candidatus Dojkabacteria bacterium]|nr:hypothetical protein [Candidatus Dojkabacteria bacterium]
MKVKKFEIKDQTIKISSGNYFAYFIGFNNKSIKSKLKFELTEPKEESMILIKAVLFDQSSLDLDCLVKVDKGIKNIKTDLKIEVLLVSKNSSAKVLPSMEIHEDDIKASHSTTIGSVDPEQLFYLESRGFSKKKAEKVIASGFIKDIEKKFEGYVPIGFEKELEKIEL